MKRSKLKPTDGQTYKLTPDSWSSMGESFIIVDEDAAATAQLECWSGEDVTLEDLQSQIAETTSEVGIMRGPDGKTYAVQELERPLGYGRYAGVSELFIECEPIDAANAGTLSLFGSWESFEDEED